VSKTSKGGGVGKGKEKKRKASKSGNGKRHTVKRKVKKWQKKGSRCLTSEKHKKGSRDPKDKKKGQILKGFWDRTWGQKN